MALGIGSLVVRKEGGGFVMAVRDKDASGRVFCVSMDRAKTVRAWFDPAELKVAERRPVTVSF